jgi:hypothetical protein
VDGILSEVAGRIAQDLRTSIYADPIVSENVTGYASAHVVRRSRRGVENQSLAHSRRYDCAVLVSVSVFPYA